MTVSGLNSDLYFSDNPIIVTVTGIDPNALYVEYSLLQFSSFTSTSSGIAPMRKYTKGATTLKFDISPSIKASFPEVDVNENYTSLNPIQTNKNILSTSLVFREVLKNGSSSSLPAFNKKFIKGGNRTYESNQNTTIGTPLIPSETIPVWGGYPIDYYYIGSNKLMYKTNQIPSELKEYRKIKGCDPVYIKFKNTRGGYSYWLFENSSISNSNSGLGIIEKYDKFIDLGSEENIRLSVVSKVPKRYIEMMEDLIVSEDVYMYRPTSSKLYQKTWIKITGINNRVNFNPFNKNEKIRLNFNLVNRFNPSVLW